MATSRPLNVLLVEDSPIDRDLLVLALRSTDFDLHWRQVATATALTDALTECWDVIVYDYHTPGFTCPAALKLVRERDLDVPFIVVSRVTDEDAAVTAMKAGAHDFLSKSKLDRLGAAIERELGEASARREHRQVVIQRERVEASAREERARAEQERERLFEELQQALRVREDFLILASHELRTPLTILRLQLDGMERSRKASEGGAGYGDDARLRIENLDHQLLRFSQMIDRLLDVTKLSSAPVRLVTESTDLGQLVCDVVKRCADWISAANCTLVLDRMDAAVGMWDPVRLESVVTNLLSNALKYGAGHRVTLSIQNTGGQARLIVRDEGIGMSEHEQISLFGKFSRAVATRNYGGLGLGLWLVDQLVRAHGGTITVSSRTGEGSTFTVVLPLEISPPAEASVFH